MGVIACSRNNCDNIMCNTQIPGVGNICNECQKEFKEYIAVQKRDIMSEHSFKVELYAFLDVPKGEYEKSKEALNIDELFMRYTR